MRENPGGSHEGFDLFCVASTFGNKDKGDKLWDDGFWNLLRGRTTSRWKSRLASWGCLGLALWSPLDASSNLETL